MKRKAKKRYVAVIALFMMLAIAACASEEEQRADKIAGIKRLTWEDIKELNGGEMPSLRYDDFGEVNAIAGIYSDFEVRDAEDALLSLYSIADLFGIEEPEEEFSLRNESDEPAGDVYMFDQYHEGIPVIGGFVSVHVDESYKTEYLIVTYKSNFPSSLQPEINRAQLEDLVKESCKGNAVAKAKLVLYPKGEYEEELILCWEVETTGDAETAMRVFFNAKTGERLYSEPLFISRIRVKDLKMCLTNSVKRCMLRLS